MAPRWDEGALVVKVFDDEIRIDRDAIVFQGVRVSREAFREARVVSHVPSTARRRQNPSAMTTYHLEVLGNMHEQFRARLFETDAAIELVRVLELWRDRPEVREAWGTSDVEALLVPTLDEALVEACGGVYTAEGIRFQSVGAFEQVDRVGCGAFLAALVVSPLAAVLGGPTWGSGLWGVVVAGLVLAYVAFYLWRSRALSEATFTVGQHGFVLADGTRVRYEGVVAVVPGELHLRVVTAADAHDVLLPGANRDLGLALHELRAREGTEPRRIPEALSELLGATQRARETLQR